MEFTARVHHEDDSYWAEVIELPGCFASGDTLDELAEALEEAVQLYLTDQGTPGQVATVEVPEMRVATSAMPQPA